VIIELRRFVSWCLFIFPVQLIAGRSFSLALCAWLKGFKRSAVMYAWTVISHPECGSLLRRLQVLPISLVIGLVFFTLLIAVKTSSLELCVDYKPISEHVVCA